MKSFFDPDRLWPAGERVLQLYVLPDLHRDRQLGELTARCREVLTGFPATDRPIPAEWLHVTIQPINHGIYEPLDDGTRQRLIDELAAAFAIMPAFQTLVGSPLAYPTGAILDLADDAAFDNLIERARKVVTAVCGPEAAGFDTRPAHMTLAYAHGEQDTGQVARALRRGVRPSHAPMTVDAVHLVEVEQVPEQCVYRWTPVQRFPLAAAENEGIEA
ncbi:MAG TPA: hypothetical protein VGL46_09195 [Pseudonocardiaceae bacterium]|jgi:2'-5' RNA ligase